MTDMDQQSGTEGTDRDYERGPNGFPYVDASDTKVAGWASGDYKLQLAREDGEMLIVNLTPEQMAAFVDQVDEMQDLHEEAMESDPR